VPTAVEGFAGAESTVSCALFPIEQPAQHSTCVMAITVTSGHLIQIAHPRPRKRTLPLTRSKPIRGEAMSVDSNVPPSHELSEYEISAVHGGSLHGIPLTTNYRTLFSKFALDIDKNQSNNKLNYLMSPDFSGGFRYLP
jgi:hypothetical protein